MQLDSRSSAEKVLSGRHDAPMKRILIIKLSAFGDLVQAEGAIHDIRNHHQDAEIILMTTPSFRELMEKCPWIDSVVIDPRDSRWRLEKMLSLRTRLRKLAVTMVYDLQQVGRTAFYHRWFLPDVPWPVGGGDMRRGSRPDLEHMGAMDRFAVQLAEAGISVQYTLRPDPGWMAADVAALLRAKNISRPYVVLIPGCSAGHDDAKRWPHYDSLAAWLRSEGKEVVTVPGPDELELCRSLTHATMLTEGAPFLTLCELAGVLRQAAFIVGNDTGPTHLAAHLGRPGLALFSSKHFPPARTGIQHSRFSWLAADFLRDLPFAEVREKIEENFLAGSSQPPFSGGERLILGDGP